MTITSGGDNKWVGGLVNVEVSSLVNVEKNKSDNHSFIAIIYERLILSKKYMLAIDHKQGIIEYKYMLAIVPRDL